jgi:hypothetical protein
MGHFFKIGLQMDEMEEEQKMKLNNEMNELLLTYNIDLNIYNNEG